MPTHKQIFSMYQKFEKRKGKEVRDLRFLIQPYEWIGPIYFNKDYLENLDIWVDFTKDSLTSKLTNSFKNRSAKQYTQALLQNYDILKLSDPNYIYYLETLRKFFLSGEVIPPILILKKTTNRKNGNIVDGMHRIITFLSLIYEGKIEKDHTLKGYLGV